MAQSASDGLPPTSDQDKYAGYTRFELELEVIQKGQWY